MPTFWEAPATPRAKASLKEEWFGRITADNVEAAVTALGWGWYALGVLYLVLSGVLAWRERVYPPNLIDGFFCLTGGFFLIRRKSRAVAVGLLAYALLAAAVTLLGWFGIIAAQNETNVSLAANLILAITAVFTAWRSFWATSVYKVKMNYKIWWVHVIWVWFWFLLMEAVAFFAVSTLYLRFQQVGEKRFGDILVIVMGICAIALLVPLTRRYPFCYSAEARAQLSDPQA